MVYVAVFFIWLDAAQPIGLQSLQAFKDRPACVAYVRPLLAKVRGGIRVTAHCPTDDEAFKGNYGEAIQ